MSKKFCVFALAFVLLIAGAASAALAAGRAVWSFNTDAGITGNIAVAGDLILAGDASGKFYAVNKNTGRLAWSYYGKNSIVGTPAVSGSSALISKAEKRFIFIRQPPQKASSFDPVLSEYSPFQSYQTPP